MKKVLSLVLAFAMILGSFGFVFANQYPDVKDTEYYSEPVNVLSGLGVVGGFPDGTFGTGKAVTRAQMATMLINCLGIPVSGQADTQFSDVPKSHWASGFIKYAANMGYVAGYTDGSFKPDKEVSYDEALTMIVASLGYTSEGLGGTWPGNFINQARGLGILKICKTTGSAPATREDVCCFLYKALTANIGKTNKDGEFVATVVETLPPFNTPVYDTMISRLGAVLYDNGNPFVVTGNEDSQVNLGEYLGAYITAYEDEESGDIIAIKEVLSEFVEDTVKNIKKTLKDTDASIWGSTNDVPYFKNGEGSGTDYVDHFTDTDVIKIAVEKKNAKTVKTLYSIQAWDVTKADMADEDVQEEINDDHKLLGESFVEDDDKEIDMNSFVLLGRDSLADIAEDDVVYVYSNSKGIAKIEVGTETVEGKISKIDNTNFKYTIGGKVYGYGAEAATSKADLQTAMTDKSEGTFYLDYAGDIYFFDPATSETTDAYGVVLRSWTATVEDETNNYVEIFTAEGSTVKLITDVAAPANGTLVMYTTDEDDVVTAFKLQTGPETEWSISKNGLHDGKKLTTATVVFKFSGDSAKPEDVKNAKKYAVEEASPLFGEKIKTVSCILKDTTVKAIMYSGVADTSAKELAFFLDAGDLTPEGALWQIFNDGKLVELNVKKTVTPPAMYAPVTLTMKDDLVTGVTDASSSIKGSLDVVGLSSDPISYSGNVFTSTDGSNYDMDADIIVYVCDADGDWKVGSKSALKAKADKLSKVLFYETTDDGAFDIVFVVEKPAP